MHVYVNDGKTRLRVILPTGLFLNRLTAQLAPKYLTPHGIDLAPEQILEFIKAIRAYKRSHPDWVLAQVRSADGAQVYVKL